MAVSGQVFNIQRFSIHDGPGVRTTVFLKGCPADCWWCHNPEGIASTPQTMAAPEDSSAVVEVVQLLGKMTLRGRRGEWRRVARAELGGRLVEGWVRAEELAEPSREEVSIALAREDGLAIDARCVLVDIPMRDKADRKLGVGGESPTAETLGEEL